MTADSIVFAVCLAIACLFLGVEIGKQHQPLICRDEPGQQVVATIAPDTCVYVQSIYGRAVRRVKAKKS